MRLDIDLKSDFDLDLILRTIDFLFTMYVNQTNGWHLENGWSLGTKQTTIRQQSNISHFNCVFLASISSFIYLILTLPEPLFLYPKVAKHSVSFNFLHE